MVHQHNHPSQSAGSTSGSAPTAGLTLSSSAPTSDGHTLMRQSIMAQQQQQQTSTNYDYLLQQRTGTNPLVSHHHHHKLSQPQLYIAGQQQSQQQSGQQNQLLLQQRAIAAANAKLYQQHQLNRVGAGQYNTLASSKPQQHIQYYIAQHPTVGNITQQGSQTAPQQQSQQYFATLGRHQHAQAQQQYLNSLSSQQQQMQQQQFATLTRHHQQQLLQPQQAQQVTGTSTMQQQQQQNLVNYHLIQQQRAQQQFGPTGSTTTARLIQPAATAINPNRQTPVNVGQTTKIAYSGQYQQQQPQQAAPMAYTRKSVVEWTGDDVQEWLQRIGMAEHRMKFEAFNGAKMLRLDNNSLANIGVRQQQHRIYILEKLKQQIWQNHNQ